jgi:hypothetical protein
VASAPQTFSAVSGICSDQLARDARALKGIEHRVDRRRRCADRSQFADPFGTERIVDARGCLVHRHVEMTDEVGARERVVEE